MKTRVGVLTRSGDAHAYAIRHALGLRGIVCAIVETDAIATSGGLSWLLADVPSARLPTNEGGVVDVADLDLIWWRRFTGTPKLPEWLTDPAARDLVERECRVTLVGAALTVFGGTWVSDPEATRLAENKLVQLAAGRRVGLRMPRTLISQDPATIREFCSELDHQVVIKTVAGTPLTPIMTGRIAPEMLASDQALALCPAIFQELIPGKSHLRVCCFGDRTHAALLTSDRLDWRYPLDAEAQSYRPDAMLVDQLQAVMAQLKLRMGIFDLKLAPDGEAVWLEINPQGQFLFLEGMCGMPLTDAFADFLVAEMEAPSSTRAF